MLAAMAFYSPAPVDTAMVSYGVVAMVCMLALLMISKLRYRSFKNVDLRARRPHPLVALLAIIFALIANAPQTVLLLMAAVYVASGPAERLWTQFRRRQQEAVATNAPESDIDVAPDAADESR